MLKAFLPLVLVLSLNSTTVHAQDDLLFEEPFSRLDSLWSLLPHWKDTISGIDLNIALEIRKSSRRYAMDHRVYTYIIRGALNADQPEVAERYSRELFPIFQFFHLNRKHMYRSISCRDACFYLSDYYYSTCDINRCNHYLKLTVYRFNHRKCGVGRWASDYYQLMRIIDNYASAGQQLKAKHWQRKAKRFHRRHLA